MLYLCIGYLEPERMDNRPKDEIEKVMSECWPYLEELYKTGQVIMDAGLEETKKSLRQVNGKVRVVDGPFTETKEVIGSTFLIEAENIEDAIRIASLHPTLQVEAGEAFGWGIEIRPVHYFEMRGPK